jgi:hypothetical protein
VAECRTLGQCASVHCGSSFGAPRPSQRAYPYGVFGRMQILIVNDRRQVVASAADDIGGVCLSNLNSV